MLYFPSVLIMKREWVNVLFEHQKVERDGHVSAVMLK